MTCSLSIGSDEAGLSFFSQAKAAPMSQATALIKAADKLRKAVDKLDFSEPTAYVYNPLRYAWDAHKHYLERYGDSKKRIVFLGMNPGPYGMAQTGVPFGEIEAVRDWMGIDNQVKKPEPEHPKRPIEGFDCTRSEVSGRRLWGAFADRFGSADAFFAEHFVINFCPLVFMEDSGRNRTPDKLPSYERVDLDEVCRKHLRQCIEILEPEFLVGVGAFAEKQGKETCADICQIKRVLHPSPASPIANRGWAEQMCKQMIEQDLW